MSGKVEVDPAALRTVARKLEQIQGRLEEAKGAAEQAVAPGDAAWGDDKFAETFRDGEAGKPGFVENSSLLIEGTGAMATTFGELADGQRESADYLDEAEQANTDTVAGTPAAHGSAATGVSASGPGSLSGSQGSPADSVPGGSATSGRSDPPSYSYAGEGGSSASSAVPGASAGGGQGGQAIGPVLEGVAQLASTAGQAVEGISQWVEGAAVEQAEHDAPRAAPHRPRGETVPNNAREDLLTQMLVGVRRQAEALDDAHEQRAALTVTGTAADGRITVRVNADGALLETRFDSRIDELSYEEIAEAVTEAVGKAQAEAAERDKQLYAGVREAAPRFGKLSELIESLPDYERYQPRPRPAATPDDSSDSIEASTATTSSETNSDYVEQPRRNRGGATDLTW
ncbi:YbaB/EbfC family nucleoid-associated protein [Nocardia sp. BMG51109]|uniref:YbaB/EbfC family nucleoid-associated protein n=1 Tax=Nocardia sp. BMG51109 TaxID=1056816 RepID=UPI0004664DA4|nr:YbaB/EbfC family nucleoid-associated protein [Nocardia sp. BMG51109]